MVSTPNVPEGLFEQIEKEPEEKCIYKRLLMDYTYGLDRIYTDAEIAAAKASPSFPREYDLKYIGLIGNVFHTKDIETVAQRGLTKGDPTLTLANRYSVKAMGLDPCFGSSAFGVCITELVDGQASVLYAEEYPRPDYNSMIDTVMDLIQRYGLSFESQSRIFVDGANPDNTAQCTSLPF